MSDQIPVGSPPVPPGRHAAPGGWYPDPTDAARERYWDGWQWSRQTRESTAPKAPAPTTHPPTAVGPGGSAPTGPGTPAGWWRRAAAVMLDWLLLTVVTTVLLAPLYLRINERLQPLLQQMIEDALRGEPTTTIATEEWITQSEQFTVAGVTLVLALAYHILLLRFRGATLGKMAIGLKVVTLPPSASEPTTDRLTWRSCVLRSLVWVVPGQSSCLWPVRAIDALLPLRHPRRQALHDILAATQVIRTR